MPQGETNTYILCIETSTDVCSVALCNNSKVISSKSSDVPNSHTEQLTLIIAEVLKNADVLLSHLSAIAISHGPGSYTSLRVGASTAKGLCYTLDIPLIALGSLDILASSLNSSNLHGVIMPMIDARRMEVYTSIYIGDTLKKPMHALILESETIAELIEAYGHVHVCGSGAMKCYELIGQENATLHHTTANAIHMVDLAYIAYGNEAFEDVAYYNPEYLKSPNITISSKKFF